MPRMHGVRRRSCTRGWTGERVRTRDGSGVGHERWALRALRFAFTACVLTCATGVRARAEQPQDLANQSLEDLMKVEVTSASKKEQTLSRTAAAVFVITQEDIQRSGAANIPDVLRRVPGMDVAQINANNWAVSARGLNGQFSNELLVLLDGRNVYTPTFGGVFWDTMDLPLENIERIEVILGPGASVWGENAVNGVVNIIRKKAGETKGGMVTAGAGNTNGGFATAQYGGSLAERMDYRVYAKYFDQHDDRSSETGDAGDGWHLLRGGFRTDATLSNKDALIVEGDMYTGREGDPTYALSSILAPGPQEVELFINVSGGFFQTMWTHTSSERSDFTVMGSFDTYERSDLLADHRKTASFDFRHHYRWKERQEVVWGGAFRYSDATSIGSNWISLVPPNQSNSVVSAFVQDEIAVIRDKLYITVGSKFESNTYTGFAAMPTVRALYAFSDKRSIWAAISRAERVPAEIDTSLRLNVGAITEPNGAPAAISAFGNPHVKDEGDIAYEAGFRTMVNPRLSIDLAAYYNDYDHQISDEPQAPFTETTPAPPHEVLSTINENLLYGETHGAEISAKWKLTKWWTLDPSYDFERIHMHREAGSLDTETGPGTEGSDPHQHGRLRSMVDVTKSLTWNAAAYFTDRLEAQGVPSYTRLDTNLIWRLSEKVTLGMYGQNLLSDHHLEFFDPGSSSTRSTLIRRSGYAKLTWRF
jgi:iron complex outermembrane recepter protein